MILQHNSSSVNYKKPVGIGLICLSLFFLLCMIIPTFKPVGMFLFGVFGWFGFVIFLFTILIGVALIKNARYRFSVRYVIFFVLAIFCFVSILQLAFTHKALSGSVGEYFKMLFKKVTPGGLLFGFLAFLLNKVVYEAGAYVFFIIAMAVFIALIIDYRYAHKQFKKVNKQKSYIISKSAISLDNASSSILTTPQNEEIQQKPALIAVQNKIENEQKPAIIKQEEVARPSVNEQKRQLTTAEEALYKLGLRKPETQKVKDEDLAKKLREYILTPNSVQTAPYITDANTDDAVLLKKQQTEAERDFIKSLKPQKRVYDANFEQTLRDNYISPKQVSESFDGPAIEPEKEVEDDGLFITDTVSHNGQSEPQKKTEPTIKQDVDDIENRINNILNSGALDDEIEEKQAQEEDIKTVSDVQQADLNSSEVEEILDDGVLIEDVAEEIIQTNAFDRNSLRNVELEIEKTQENIEETIQTPKETTLDNRSQHILELKKKIASAQEKPVQESIFGDQKPSKEPPKFTVSNAPYNKPLVELLQEPQPSVNDETDEEIEHKKQVLEDTLESFKVPAKVSVVLKGPTVTRYELQMPPGKTVKLIEAHALDISYALASNGKVRIEAPIPNKNAVGIEVPNKSISTVYFREIVESPEFQRSNPLSFALGKDIAGTTMLCDLTSMPHLLVAGATGSGKSVCLNVLLCSLIYKLSPADLKLILVDPKRVEFTAYNGLPHMLIPEAITEPKDAINALNWVIEEMERRYDLFRECGVNHINEYNRRESVKNGTEQKLPIIVIVIDELADLMITAKRDAEERIRRIVALARASGIHLIVATQRPSVDVITGTIKANLPSRIAFQVTNSFDSKTILDQTGAESLLGRGDMLYNPYNYPVPKRIQCAYISLNEVKNVVAYIKENNQAYFDEKIVNQIFKKSETEERDVSEIVSDRPVFDPLLPKALKLAIETKSASVSLFQRRFSIGFARAARILDQMEQHEFVSPPDDNRSKPRSVYLSMEDFKSIFGDDV